VAWVALTPLLVALGEAPSPRHGFRLGYVAGAVSSLGIVYWTSIVVVQFGGLALPLGVAVMVLLCLALALFPSVFGWKTFTDAGGLISYGPIVRHSQARLAYFVDKILKGAKPSELPVEQPKKFFLVINLNAAKRIALTIPPNVLTRADKVIK